MKWHLYQFESQLYLGSNIKSVSSHVVSFHKRDHYTITQLDDDTMVKIGDEVLTIGELTTRYQAKARQEGYEVNDKLSYRIRNGKTVTISHETDEIMA